MTTSPLPASVADTIDRVCDAFEGAWREGRQPRLEDLLSQVEEPFRSRLWAELVLTELECRRRKAEAPTMQEYLDRFPDRHDDVARLFQSATVPTTPAAASVRAAVEPARHPRGYELLEQVGRGGMGVVYRARQVALRRTVAVKMILAGAHADQEERARFRQEAEAAARLQHPHIIQVHEVGDDGGLPFLVMEFVDGPSLDQLLTRWHGQGSVGLLPAQAARLVETLARAIHYAHERGVVHRDLKPANVLMGDTARPQAAAATPKITDFGLAKFLDGGGERTRTGTVLGTPSYMAPEQAGTGAAPVGPPADVYALGTILYELLTGRVPFQAATVTETLELVRNADPVPPGRLQPALPRDLQTICLACLHKEPARRYGSAERLAEDLRRFQAGEPILARPTSRAERVVKWVKRRPAVALLLASAAAAVALLVGGWIWWEADEAARRQEALLRQQTTAQQAQQLLGTVPELRAAGQPAAALAQASKAVGLLEHVDGLDGLRQQARGLLVRLEDEDRSQRLVARLEAIRLLKTTRGGRFDVAELAAALVKAFRERGIDVEALTPAQTAERLTPEVRVPVAEGLTFWAGLLREGPGKAPQRWQHLLAVAQAVDPDPDRCRAREALLHRDRKALVALAGSAKVATLPAATLALLGEALGQLGEHALAVALLRTAQREHAGEFWINHHLAVQCEQLQPPRREDAVRYHTAAVALRPHLRGAQLNLGNALFAQGRMREALEVYQKLTRSDASYGAGFYMLGSAHFLLDERAQAVAAFERAIALDAKDAAAYHGLGLAYSREHQFPEAVATLRKALALCPEEAEYHCHLGKALGHAGLFAESLAHFERGHELGSRQPKWRSPSALWVEQAQELVKLDAKLPAVLAGKLRPEAAAEWIGYAQVCYHKRLYGTSARYFRTAFSAKPDLAASVAAAQYHNAACAAARAGCGEGVDAARYDDYQRSTWRQWAVRCLTNGLAYWKGQLASANPQARDAARQALRNWQRDRPLAGVRDPQALARLSVEERDVCQQFWAEVADLVARSEKEPGV